MGRKSERSKSKKEEKSPKHTSRSGRVIRRKKKSQSDSDEEQQPQQSESRSVRKSRRGQKESTPSQGESSQAADWKEDETFWQASGATQENKEGSEDTVWKVQTSNGSGGEIQKLRICRQRPVGGSASDSAESSMSPHKDSTQSPKHVRSLRRENQKSPLVDSVSTDAEPIPDQSSEPQQSNEASEFTLPLLGQPVVEYVYETQPNFMSIREPSPIRLPVSPDQVISQFEDQDEPVLEITTETLDEDKLDETPQPPVQRADLKVSKTSDKVQADTDKKTDKISSKGKGITTADDDVSKTQSKTDKEKSIERGSVKKESSESKNPSKTDERRVSVDTPQPKEQRRPSVDQEKRRTSVDTKEQSEKRRESVDTKEQSEKRRESVDRKEQSDKRKESLETPDNSDKLKGSSETPKERRTSDDKKSTEKTSVSMDTKEISEEQKSKEKTISEERRTSADEKESEKKHRISVDIKEEGGKCGTSEDIDKQDKSTGDSDQKDKRRISFDKSQEDITEGKVDTLQDKTKPSIETQSVSTVETSVLETTADLDTTKEEGEIVDDSPASIKQRRLIKFNSTVLSTDTKPAKITINRRSTTGQDATSTSSQPQGGGSTTGSSQPATTAKKHPLITGPEADEKEPPVAVASRRRKLSDTLSSSTRTVITPAGTTRQVRSIPGQALKAVLQPEPEVKKEKRIKLVKTSSQDDLVDNETKVVERSSRVPERKVTTEPRAKSTEVKKESKVGEVEDVREIIRSNRDKKLSETSTPTNNRKVHIGPLDDTVSAVKPPRSSSPGDSKATCVLFISNLVRPFTAGQLKELLSRTGQIAENGFFIDRIKSKCFVKYIDVEMAIETRHALNGVKWPISNPKTLKVTYASDKDMKQIQDSADGEVVEHLQSKTSGSWLSSEQPHSDTREKRKSGSNLREWDRGKEMDVIYVDQYSGKDRQAPGLEDRLRDRREVREKHSDKHTERDRRKRRGSTERNQENSPPPARKFKKKDYDAPAKLLDDLFRKTKTTPCLYWLPLSSEQIAVKEEARRKHMAEAERRMTELKKSQELRRERDKERRRK